jgi:hypothetical protein
MTNLSSEDFFTEMYNPSLYTRHFTKSFVDKMNSPANMESEKRINPYATEMNFEPKSFLVPKQTIMSPARAKRRKVQGEVIEVPYYSTKTHKLPAETQRAVERKMLNGIREYIREKMQSREII